jgi:uncharacterized iron-regulated membrane protein
MSPATRKPVARLHLWLGLPAAVVYLVVALTGALLVFEKDLDRTWHPELWRVDRSLPALPLEQLFTLAQAAAPGRELKEMRLAIAAGKPIEFRFERGPHVRLDPGTGAVLGTRARGDSFFGLVERLHTSLVLGETGRVIVIASSVVLVVLLGTGLALWWPKQWRQLKGAVTLAFGRKGRAFHFNLHNTLGFWSALPLFTLALTGSIIGLKPLGDLVRSLGGKGQEPRPPVATSAATLPPASLDMLAVAARRALPDAREYRLFAPRGAVAGNAAQAWRVEAISVSAPHEHARSRAYLDPRTAAVLRVDRFASLPLGARLRALARPIHDGSILGRPTQFIAFAAVLLLPVLSVTGVALWWLKRRAQLAQKRCAARGLIPPPTSPTCAQSTHA